MDYALLGSFIIVAVVLTLSPGPDILFVMAQSMSNGKRAGMATALGLCSGITVHTMAAALGISAVLYQSNTAFQIVKYAGALYLLYMAWQAFKEGNAPLAADGVEKRSMSSLYRKGILMNILNPKVSLFFLALLPQFVSTKAGSPVLQMVILGLVFMIQAVVIFTLVAMFAGSIGQRLLRYPKMNGYINKGKAGLFALIGIRIALAEK
ncbi:MAG TPA: LysE family translocator [Bacillus sp. (in: firmicutes)]|nr:LysE family translocator [Bacillus sp. (in: firmicutes)]